MSRVAPPTRVVALIESCGSVVSDRKEKSPLDLRKRSSMSSEDHQRLASEMAADRPIRVAILTVSDTRTPETDVGGDLADRLCREAGFAIAHRGIVRDDAGAVRTRIRDWLADHPPEAILTTGGTGIARRDTTIEVVRDCLEKELEGFGELFRMLSFDQVDAAAMLSRAVAGLAKPLPGSDADTFLFAMPGSPNAVETAMKRLIVPQLPHLIWERKR